MKGDDHNPRAIIPEGESALKLTKICFIDKGRGIEHSADTSRNSSDNVRTIAWLFS